MDKSTYYSLTTYILPLVDQDKELAISMMSDIIASIQVPAIYMDKRSEAFYARQHHWHNIKKMLFNFFSGNPDQFDGVNFDYYLLDQREKQRLALFYEFDKWRSLYILFSDGWMEIKANSEGIDMPASSPGEALGYIFVGHAKNNLRSIDMDRLPNPTTCRRAWLQSNRYEKIKDSASPAIVRAEKKKLDTYLNQIKQKQGDSISEHLIFQQVCLDICLKSKRRNVRESAEEFQKKMQRHSDELARGVR